MFKNFTNCAKGIPVGKISNLGFWRKIKARIYQDK